VTTITPGQAPSTQAGELFLWPGMSNGTGDLVQTTLKSWLDNSWCGATNGAWCIRCSLFGSFGQLDGTASAVSGSMSVEIVYELQSDGTTWKQTAPDVASGTQLSTFSYDSGPYMVSLLTNKTLQNEVAPLDFSSNRSANFSATDWLRHGYGVR
jgi:hypothetical protein